LPADGNQEGQPRGLDLDVGEAVRPWFIESSCGFEKVGRAGSLSQENVFGE